MPQNWFQKRPLFSPSPKPGKPPKKKWRIHYILWSALKRTCMVIGALVLFGAIVGVYLSSRQEQPELPQDMVLYLPLNEAFPEHNTIGFDLQASFGQAPLTLREAVAVLDAAARDERVHGIVAEFKGAHYSLAQLQELRAALLRFKAASGKFAYIYAESYGESGVGMSTYYLASAFDEIWLQPMGTLALAGVKIEAPFVRSVLDKVGVEPAFFARKEYKNVFESFTADEMSKASKESTRSMVESLAGQMLAGIAEGRARAADDIRAQVKTGIFTGREALERGLIDRLDYGDVLVDEIQKNYKGEDEAKEDILFMALTGYAAGLKYEKAASLLADIEKKGKAAKTPKVALLYAVGAIVTRADGVSYGGEGVVSAEGLSGYIDEVADDDSIKVIVLRIDSPGGSPTASETIRRSLVKAQEKDKTVIVSMANAAASGGYWIAAPADRIFALPGTLTGSIGVAGGKFILQGLWNKVGVNWDGMQWGENAGLWSMNEPLTPATEERFNAMMDQIYDGFIARVAEGRKLSPEKVEAVARGRVWTGAQALENGLVDELGGLTDALDYSARLLGAADRSGISIVVLPKRLSPLEQLVDLVEGQVRMGDAVRAYLPFLQSLVPVANQLETQAKLPPVNVFQSGLSRAY